MRKVPGGKLLRVKADCADGIVSKVLIEGDFFLYPEEGVTKLEHALIGAKTSDAEDVRQRIERTIQENHLQLMGFSSNGCRCTTCGRRIFWSCSTPPPGFSRTPRFFSGPNKDC